MGPGPTRNPGPTPAVGHRNLIRKGLIMRDHPWRDGRWKAAVPATAMAGAAVTAGLTSTGDARPGTLSGTLYRDPSSQVVRWVQANPNDTRTPVIRDKIASQPQARWMAAFNPSTVTSEVSGVVNAASSANQIPLLSVYEIPNRDCGGASAGGAPDLGSYQTWVSNFSRGLGNQTVIIILETDSLALQTCLSASDVTARDNALSQAVRTIKSANGNAKVYL